MHFESLGFPGKSIFQSLNAAKDSNIHYLTEFSFILNQLFIIYQQFLGLMLQEISLGLNYKNKQTKLEERTTDPVISFSFLPFVFTL